MLRPHPCRSALPGVVVTAAIALLAVAAPAVVVRLPDPVSGLVPSPILVAILLGLATAGVARKHPEWEAGLKLATGPLLKLAVMLIGLRLSVGLLGGLGAQALPLVLAALAAGLGLAWLLGHLLGVGFRLTALLAVGSAICGVSAIAATAPALKAPPEETAYALACVALIGLAATLLYPWLLGTWLSDGWQIGLVLGATIHDTAQVTAAALMLEQSSGQPGVLSAAVVTKLLRNLSMLFVIPAVVGWALREGATAAARPAFPWFIGGFVALAAVRSAGDALAGESEAWVMLPAAASHASAFLFAMAIAAIGMGIRVAELRALGVKPAIVACLITVGMFVAVSSATILLG
jgi:uncharacterized integral membrane protein (TIGR00698 family)